MPSLTLRPYQNRAVESVITAWESDPRVCLALPTGSGKTVVAAGLIQAAQADGMRCAFRHRSPDPDPANDPDV